MKRWIATQVQAAADRLGYSIAPKWRLQNLALAGHLRSLFRAYGIDAVIDIGANEGGFGRFLRLEAGFTGRVFSFEPAPATFAQLQATARDDPAWQVHNLALGEAAGTQTLNIMDYDVFNSFLTPSASQDPLQARNSVVGQQAVNVVRLEDWAQAHLAHLPDTRFYLKIDTQGYELPVLRGAGRFLDRVAACQAEIPFRKLYDGVPDYWTTLETWHAAGFDVSDMFVTSHDSAERAIEFDCVMINRRFLAARDTPNGP